MRPPALDLGQRAHLRHTRSIATRQRSQMHALAV
jgi:hypothetical protein